MFPLNGLFLDVAGGLSFRSPFGLGQSENQPLGSRVGEAASWAEKWPRGCLHAGDLGVSQGRELQNKP